MTHEWWHTDETSLGVGLPNFQYGYGGGYSPDIVDQLEEAGALPSGETGGTPEVTDEVLSMLMSFLPVAGTAYNWEDMGNVERVLSILFDAVDVATFGGGKLVTAPMRFGLMADRLRTAGNPLSKLYPDDVLQIRYSAPGGSPDWVVGKEGIPTYPKTITDPDVLKNLRPSVNIGSPGGYATEEGISGYLAKRLGDMSTSEQDAFLSKLSDAYQEILRTSNLDEYLAPPILHGKTTKPLLPDDLVRTVPEDQAGAYGLTEDTIFVRPTEAIPNITKSQNVPKGQGTFISEPRIYPIMGTPIIQQAVDRPREAYGGIWGMRGPSAQAVGSDMEPLISTNLTELFELDPRHIYTLSPEMANVAFEGLNAYGLKNVPGGVSPFRWLGDLIPDKLTRNVDRDIYDEVDVPVWSPEENVYMPEPQLIPRLDASGNLIENPNPYRGFPDYDPVSILDAYPNMPPFSYLPDFMRVPNQLPYSSLPFTTTARGGKEVGGLVHDYLSGEGLWNTNPSSFTPEDFMTIEEREIADEIKRNILNQFTGGFADFRGMNAS